MIISTMNELPGYQIEEVLGEVFGLTVRSRNVGSQIGASFKSMVGGELKGMTKLLAVLDQPDQPGSDLALNREDGFWLIGSWTSLAYASGRAPPPAGSLERPQLHVRSRQASFAWISCTSPMGWPNCFLSWI